MGTVVEYASVMIRVVGGETAERVSHLNQVYLGQTLSSNNTAKALLVWLRMGIAGLSRSLDSQLPVWYTFSISTTVYVSAGRVLSPVWTLES
jgi:hypothetical protein